MGQSHHLELVSLTSGLPRSTDITRSTPSSMLIIDKNLKPLMAIADRYYILEKGTVTWAGTSADLRQQGQTINRYLAVH
jgi:branched-chain amino acid transport system ATP-binding protein